MKCKRPGTTSFIHSVPALNVRDLTYTCMNTHRHAATHACTHRYMHAHMHTCKTTYAYILSHMDTHSHSCTCIQAHMHTYERTHTTTDTCIRTTTQQPNWQQECPLHGRSPAGILLLLAQQWLLGRHCNCSFSSSEHPLVLSLQRSANVHLWNKIKFVASLDACYSFCLTLLL